MTNAQHPTPNNTSGARQESIQVPKHEPKLNLIIVALITAWFLLADIVDIILKFVGLDDFLIVDILTWPITLIYFRLKGVNQTYNVTMGITELIPYIGTLPLRTFGVIMVAYLDRHPQLEAEVMKVASKIPTKGGGKPMIAAKPK